MTLYNFYGLFLSFRFKRYKDTSYVQEILVGEGILTTTGIVKLLADAKFWIGGF